MNLKLWDWAGTCAVYIEYLLTIFFVVRALWPALKQIEHHFAGSTKLYTLRAANNRAIDQYGVLYHRLKNLLIRDSIGQQSQLGGR